MWNNKFEKNILLLDENPLDDYDILEKEKSFKNNNDNYSSSDNSFHSFHPLDDDKINVLISNINIQKEKEKEENNYKKNLFLTTKRKKPGRKPLTKNKNKKLKEHDKFEKSNILKKILTHFITFLIYFSNDAIKSVFTKQQFKDIFLKIEHKSKFNIEIKSKNIHQIKLEQIFDYPISLINNGINPKKGKNKNIDFKHNKKVYENIKKLSPKLNEFFKQNIIDIFQDYFCVDKKTKDVVYFKDIKIKLSPETKTFYDFLEFKDNINMRNRIIEIVNKSYECNL